MCASGSTARSDYQGIARALFKNASAGHIVQGGSTITQQLVRNLYIGKADRTFSRKLKEACLARSWRASGRRSRSSPAYLNEVFYGRHAYGRAGGCADVLLDERTDADAAQAALLAGLPQAPSLYDPLRRPNDALARRNECCARCGHTDTSRRPSTPGRPQHRSGSSRDAVQRATPSNFFGWATQQLVDRFGERRVQPAAASANDARPAHAVRGPHGRPDVLRVKTDPAAALVAIDPRTGAVKAMSPICPTGA